MKTCPDCGCRIREGMCTNCQEELYILTYQIPEIDDPNFTVSNEFREKAEEQREYLRRRNERNG